MPRAAFIRALAATRASCAPRGLLSARRRQSRAAVLCAFLALAAGACGGRDRANPFDPANEETGGTPRAARASAGCAQVELAWDRLAMRDLSGFRVWRELDGTAGGPGELLTDQALDARTIAFVDSAAPNGRLAAYRVEFLFENGASGWTDPAVARPGPALAWAADPCGYGLVLLTPDARRIRGTRAYGSTVLDVEVDPRGGRLFAASVSFPSAVLVMASDGGGEPAEIPLEQPTAISWSDAASALAVASFYQGRVDWLRPDGSRLGAAEFPGWHPEDVAFRDGERTWVALVDESAARGVLVAVNFQTGRRDTLCRALVRPVAIVDDPRGLGCWVADRAGAVFFVADDGSARRTAEGAFRGPTDLDSDSLGCCWVADPEAGTLSRVDREGAIVRVIAGWPGVRGVTWDPESEALWVAVPDLSEVACLGVAGGGEEILGSGAVAGCPQKVAGDWRGGCRARLPRVDLGK